MAHFAKVINNIVVEVIVAEQDYIDTLPDKWAWVQTSYNTYGGKHTLGGTPLRKNYAGIGFKYDKELDAFIPPQPYPSWKLDTDTCLWNAPIPYPQDDKQYIWNEAEQEWTYTGYFFEDGELKKEE
jgi:hypothetical protein